MPSKSTQTVNGRLPDEDADSDVYKFHARAGERLSFIVHAARLQKPVPYLTELKSFSDITPQPPRRTESGIGRCR